MQCQHRRWIAGLSILACLTVMPTTTQADSLNQAQQHMGDLQSQKSQMSSVIQQDQSKAQQLHSEIQSSTNSVTMVNQKLSSVEQREATLTNKLVDLQKRITKTNGALNTDQRQLINRLRLLYENGNVNYLSVLLDSTSFSDFLTRWQFLELMSQQDHLLAEKARLEKGKLAAQQSTYQNTSASLGQDQAQLELLKATDKALGNRQQQALEQVQNRLSPEQEKYRVLESNIRLTVQQIADIRAQTLQAQQRMADPAYLRQARQVQVSVDANALIHHAMQYLGVPYMWGGTSPGGFDCSGFTQYVFAQSGVTLGRSAADQFSQGIPVDKGQLHPDDLVFFSTYAPGATHVGIYIGNGTMIDAQDNGVSIDSIDSSYWASGYIGARRYTQT